MLTVILAITYFTIVLCHNAHNLGVSKTAYPFQIFVSLRFFELYVWGFD